MANFDSTTIPPQVLELVERFQRNRESYMIGAFNETQIRREFLDPFFKALGWDVENEQGYAEAYKDVIHEDAIKVGEATKAPDYCFRIGGTRKFFLEAKRPSIDIKNDTAPAFQLRRYGWTSKLPISILSNFEEFAVYDCRYKPDQNDSAVVGRIFHMSYLDYTSRWSEIVEVFSRDAVLKGSFDKFTEKSKSKRGVAVVDDDFLETIETWRKDLAENLALRNKELSQRELNFSVQRIIDRIIFLRICEGRGIEDYGRLRTVTTGDGIYKRLTNLFKQADDKYNSGLFHFRAEKGRSEARDELTLNLKVDDKLLRSILKSLYYPDSPYVFSALPADVLGQVYEQFLGKIIRLTEGHRAKIEDKPDVKKAGGVYYTPTYIVDYVVKTSVGRLLEDRNAKQVSKLKILDPACGSGSFLLGVYEYLLGWHLAYYLLNGISKWTKGSHTTLVQTIGGNWKLTIAERKRILLDNIYGVDIDAQAVETTKLSLLLKVLEGETNQTIQPELLHERALPDLDGNIKCGNSLVASDFYKQQQLALIDEEEQYRINVFDWKIEFASIFKEGGFDAVIGNPPYLKVSGNDDPLLFNYFREYYKNSDYKIEYYALFAERAIDLVKRDGFQSFIVPNSFLAGVYLKPLRDLMADDNTLCEIVFLRNIRVFKSAKLDSVVYTLQKLKPSDEHTMSFRLADESMSSSDEQTAMVAKSTWAVTEGREFRITAGGLAPDFLSRVLNLTTPLNQLATVHLGLIVESNNLLQDSKSLNAPDPILHGRDIKRYGVIHSKHWFNFKKDKIVGGTKKKLIYQTGPRLLVQAIRNLKLKRRIVATSVGAGTYTDGTLHNIIVRSPKYSPAYLLGIINSDLLNAYYASSFPEHRIKGRYIGSLPVPKIDFNKPNEALRHNQFVLQVELMLNLQNKLDVTKIPSTKVSLQRQIAVLDQHINELVYELYSLSAEEVAMVKPQAAE